MSKQYVIKFSKNGFDFGGDAIWADRRLNYHSVMCLAHEKLDNYRGLGYNGYAIYRVEGEHIRTWTKVDEYTELNEAVEAQANHLKSIVNPQLMKLFEM